MEVKNIAVLGSTGSIGTQSLSIIREDPGLCASVLTAGTNKELLKEQIYEFRPEMVCLYDEDKARELRDELHGEHVLSESELPVIVSGMDGLLSAASHESVDTVIVALVGMIGIRPTIAAIKAHKKIALANKETLVCAGHIIMPMIREHGVELMPVDSEHSAIFQCLMGERHESIRRIYLTASGGPFRGKHRDELKDIRPEDALKHPNWSMGAKITIDSATMVNKALEVMEARWLFDVDIDDIEPIIQPRSVIHSMVEFQDGAIKAQLGAPSMLVPIAFALYAPERRPVKGEPLLDLDALHAIEFEKPDMCTFKGLRLGIEAGKKGGLYPTVFNAANEEAVALFLSGRIGFLAIADVIEETLKEDWSDVKAPDVEEILRAEQRARELVRNKLL